MPLPTDDFDTLIYRGHFHVTEELDYSGSILGAEFGWGYRADETIFPPLRACTLSYPTLHRDALIEVTTGVFVNRLNYIWDFYETSKTAANMPFLMKSPKDSKWFLWRFADDKLSFELLDLFMASSGVKLVQANVRGVTADNDDGSFEE
jgi:hypothetical protein